MAQTLPSNLVHACPPINNSAADIKIKVETEVTEELFEPTNIYGNNINDISSSTYHVIEKHEANSQMLPNCTALIKACPPNEIITFKERNTEEGSRELVTNEDSDILLKQPNLFGWCKIDGSAIPCIRRGAKKYVIVTIAEKLFFHKFSRYFTEEFAKCVIAPRYAITKMEVNIYNKINEKLCNGTLTKNSFTIKDVLVLVEDIQKMVKFLKASYEIIYKNKKDNGLFGFVRINNENSVPFVWCSELKFVPLFYFDGCDIENIGYISDRWQINYFRLCFKMQKIKKDLYDNEKQIKVVNLDLIQKLFPTETSIELHIPTEINEELLAKKLDYTNITVQPKLPKKHISKHLINRKFVEHKSVEMNLNFTKPKTNILKRSPDQLKRLTDTVKNVREIVGVGSSNTGTLVGYSKKSRNSNILTKNLKSPSVLKNSSICLPSSSVNTSVIQHLMYPTQTMPFIGNKNTDQGIERFPGNSYSMIIVTTPTMQFTQPIVSQSQPTDNLLSINFIKQPQGSGQIASNFEVENLLINVTDDSPPKIQNNNFDIIMTSKCQKTIKLHLRDFIFPVIKCTMLDGKLLHIISLTDLREKLFPKWPFKTFKEEVTPWIYNPFMIEEDSNQYHKVLHQFGHKYKSYCSGIFAVFTNITDIEKACAHLDLIG